MTITKPVSKCARGINEQLQKTAEADVLSSKKKMRKTLGDFVRSRVNTMYKYNQGPQPPNGLTLSGGF